MRNETWNYKNQRLQQPNTTTLTRKRKSYWTVQAEWIWWTSYHCQEIFDHPNCPGYALEYQVKGKSTWLQILVKKCKVKYKLIFLFCSIISNPANSEKLISTYLELMPENFFFFFLSDHMLFIVGLLKKA